MNNIEKELIIENIDKSISILKNKEILFSIIDNNKVYFMFQKDKILIMNPNSSYYLPVEQFKMLYEGYKFIIYEQNEEKFDFERDEEYYNWKHK